MDENFQFPSNIDRFIKRILPEFNSDIAAVLKNATYQINYGTCSPNIVTNNNKYGHDVIFYISDQQIHSIPLSKQDEIGESIAQNLNRASTSIRREFIHQVHFEILDIPMQQMVVDHDAIERIWEPNKVKLFISHRDDHKSLANKLTETLQGFGISSFVAHDSIEEGTEWIVEIQSALQTMDAMLVFLTDDFFKSVWTNQEIEFAFAKDIPIVVLKLQNTDPKGFLNNRQALRGSFDDVTASTKDVFARLCGRIDSVISFRLPFALSL